MPRKPLILTDEYPYHITNRSNNKTFFYLPLDDLWKIFMEELWRLKLNLDCEIICFVLMNNHYHLLLRTPRRNLSEAMTLLHTNVAKKGNYLAKRMNHFFGGRYKWCLIEEESYYWNSVRYIFQNPIRAGICSKIEEYQFSSINYPSEVWSYDAPSLRQSSSFKINQEWLNEVIPQQDIQVITSSLRRTKFSPPKRKSGKTKDLPIFTTGQTLVKTNLQ